MMKRPKRNVYRKTLLLLTASLFVVVSCVAARPFALNLIPQEAKQEGASQQEEWERAKRKALSGPEHEAAIRREMAELASMVKEAKITMEQAIQIATSQQPGTVVECRLARELDEVSFMLLIVSGDETQSTASRVQVSAIDGRVIRVIKKQ